MSTEEETLNKVKIIELNILKQDLSLQLDVLVEAMLLFRVTNTSTGMIAMNTMLRDEDILKLKIQGAGKMIEELSSPLVDKSWE